ncbi:hypothetical protein SDRG_00485 [Saprolegnia diclina VS20]|uniref:Uncharacterized protein n=1 Tax=Saprolegnia diclina (strain VS20) TaxID=1156394 RepID=T0SIJ6_SAPDV|nr:hypothetical protein SDRG_00485 [Saprolegnia diclina VS20]EQC42762.1 hypothetical protein SDRG_00485 [Saprolegnia diclina VS20]|eukprot:XP_008604185.1 hypothetical protein SDRG_00485 [Saprolegnia diclina VS20]
MRRAATGVSIVARRSQCKNCGKKYLNATSVCVLTFCSLDCQSNSQYLELVHKRLRSLFALEEASRLLGTRPSART